MNDLFIIENQLLWRYSFDSFSYVLTCRKTISFAEAANGEITAARSQTKFRISNKKKRKTDPKEEEHCKQAKETAEGDTSSNPTALDRSFWMVIIEPRALVRSAWKVEGQFAGQ